MRGRSQFKKASKESNWGVIPIKFIKKLQFQKLVYAEADHLICTANQVTCFYIIAIQGWSELKKKKKQEKEGVLRAKNNCQATF